MVQPNLIFKVPALAIGFLLAGCSRFNCEPNEVNLLTLKGSCKSTSISTSMTFRTVKTEDGKFKCLPFRGEPQRTAKYFACDFVLQIEGDLETPGRVEQYIPASKPIEITQKNFEAGHWTKTRLRDNRFLFVFEYPPSADCQGDKN